MSEPTWKRLVEDLTRKGYESPHLTRLRERMPAVTGREDVTRELVREMASSFARANDKVSAALLVLELAENDVEAFTKAPRDPGWRREMNRRIADFNEKRQQALKTLWELQVHREALGFRSARRVADELPVPSPKEPVD